MTVSQLCQRPIPAGTAHQKVKRKMLAKFFKYLFSTMKIEDTEALGRRELTQARSKPIQSTDLSAIRNSITTECYINITQQHLHDCCNVKLLRSATSHQRKIAIH